MFGEATVKPVINKTNPQSAAGPSGLRYNLLQATLYDELAEGLALLPTFILSSCVLPQIFWTLHTSAKLFALGQKAGAVACGDAIRTVTAACSADNATKK